MAGVPLVAPLSNYSAPVHINVGGTTYTSCLETLTKFPHSKLAKMFNGTLPIAVDPVKQQYFLDRDGKVFRHVLNYLRNGELTLPDHFTDTKLLLKEATFFQIEELCDALKNVSQEKADEETNVERRNQPGRRSTIRRKKNKQQQTANEVHKAQGQSIAVASVEDERNVVLLVDLQAKLKYNELICAVTDCNGLMINLICSDRQFKCDNLSMYIHPNSYNNQYYCLNIQIPNGCLGFPILAKCLFEKGYRLISSGVHQKLDKHYFVK